MSSPGWIETNIGSGVFALSLGTLASGAVSTALFGVDVVYPSGGGIEQLSQIANIADDGANGGDPAPANNIATATIKLLAPAFSSNHRRATFTDSDGDLVTVAVNRGALSAADFTIFAIDDGTRRSVINLGDDGAEFVGASLAISAHRLRGGTGDGVVHLGALDATGIDLAAVTVTGDLAQIDVGDGDVRKPALGRLNVGSLGAQGALTQPENVMEPLHSEFAGSLGKLTVKGSVRNAVVDVAGNVGAVIVGGDFDGSGGGAEAGVLRARSDILNVLVKGDFVGGADRSGIFSGGKLGRITIDGDLRSDEATKPVIITALGNLEATKQAEAIAITELHIGGSVVNARILAGYDPGVAPVNFDAGIGAIKVSGSWNASSVAAGVIDNGNDGFGQNDVLIPGSAATPRIFARIASITIKGVAMGSPTAGDHFGLVAEQIAKLTIGAMRPALFAGVDNLLLDTTNADFRVVDFT